MSHHRFVFAVRGLLVAMLLAWAASAAWASPYTSLVVFGDSLSDVGNAWVLSNYVYPPPNSGYDGGRFSNGPIWLKIWHHNWAVPPGSFFYMSGGTVAYGGDNNFNFAIGGATTQDMQSQVNLYFQYLQSDSQRPRRSRGTECCLGGRTTFSTLSAIPRPPQSQPPTAACLPLPTTSRT